MFIDILRGEKNDGTKNLLLYQENSFLNTILCSSKYD